MACFFTESFFVSLSLAVFVSLWVTRTDFFEAVKRWLAGHGCGMFAKAMDCPFCMGFWSGLAVGAFVGYASGSLLKVLLLCSASSVAAYAMAKD